VEGGECVTRVVYWLYARAQSLHDGYRSWQSDRREPKTVNAIHHYMRSTKVLYVHRNPWGVADYVVLTKSAWEECRHALDDLEPHGRIDGDGYLPTSSVTRP